jgi:hypothetical protein
MVGLTFPVMVQAENKLPGLVVVKPRITGVDQEKVDPVALANLASSLIVERGQYKVISHEDVQAMLSQGQQAILVGCDNTNCMAEIGNAMGAPYLFYSNVGKVGPTLVITVNLIDNQNAKVLQRQSITINSYGRVVEAMRVATLRLVGQQVEMSPPPDYSLYIWTALGLGTAAVLVGGVGSAMALNYQDKADGTADQNEFNDFRDKVDSCNTLAVSGYISGGALLLSSFIFYLIEPDDQPIEAGNDDHKAVSLSPLGDNGFVLGYQFRF